MCAAGADPDMPHATCLFATPSADRVARLKPVRSPLDAFVVVRAEVYLCLRNGVERSKLSNAWLDARLGVVSTTRNWRTVTKLAAKVEARRRRRARRKASAKLRPSRNFADSDGFSRRSSAG